MNKHIQASQLPDRGPHKELGNCAASVRQTKGAESIRGISSIKLENIFFSIFTRPFFGLREV